MKRRVLITGTGGFLGRNLYEYFSSQTELYSVIPLCRANVDLLNEHAVESYIGVHSPDVVVHCATVGGTRKSGYDSQNLDVVTSNLRMFFNIQRAIAKGTRLINMGSGAEYDKRAYLHKMDEAYFDSHVPADDYGYSKYLISKYIAQMDDAVTLRIFGLYGKYEDYTYKFISNAIVKALLGLPIVINQNVRFDYLYVQDMCHIVEYFVQHKVAFPHYNVTPSESITLSELGAIVSELSGHQTKVLVRNAGMNTEYTGDNSRLLAEFPSIKFTPYGAGIAGLYEYYKAALPLLDVEMVRADPYLKFCVKKH